MLRVVNMVLYTSGMGTVDREVGCRVGMYGWVGGGRCAIR